MVDSRDIFYDLGADGYVVTVLAEYSSVSWYGVGVALCVCGGAGSGIGLADDFWLDG